MNKEHHYHISLKWTGNNGSGTQTYTSYQRSYQIWTDDKPILEASSDVVFRGEKSKYNPEDLLVAALSGCHMLFYLHVCSDAGIVVLRYEDQAEGKMIEQPDGSGKFKEVVLKPSVLIIGEEGKERARALHKKANQLCFIANSVNFPVRHKPTIFIQKT